jgi:aryl-alcohol dehydrogenase-like predicted oxidoreductase
MKKAIRDISGRGRRDDLVISMLTYAHNAFLTEAFFVKGLKALGVEYADALLLGWFSRLPSRRLIDGAMKLRQKGLLRFIGLTSHNRKLFPQLVNVEGLDVYHIRYNAAHRGAETETFPFIEGANRPGVVSFTATAWKKLLDPKKMPAGEPPVTALDCYRFVLSHPAVDVCMMGARNLKQMQENLEILDKGPMSEEELDRMRRIGDHIYGKKAK